MASIMLRDAPLDLSLPKMRKQGDDSFKSTSASQDTAPAGDLPTGRYEPETRSWTYDSRSLQPGKDNRSECEGRERQWLPMNGGINTEHVYDLSSRNANQYNNEEANCNALTRPGEQDTDDTVGDRVNDDGLNTFYRWDTYTGGREVVCRSRSSGRSSSGSPNTSVSDVGDYRNSSPQKDDSEQEAEMGADNDTIERCIIGRISISMQNSLLWRAFAERGTEMIINKGGRRMFPRVLISIKGLEPDTKYSVALEISSADDRRYKFINNKWMAMGIADPQTGTQSVTHQDSPSSGRFWQDSMVSFSKVRLTNNKDSAEGNILLHSMHKYTSSIVITNETTGEAGLSFEFPEASFIAVTAYQNNEITELKIQNNPFAKAFRDTNCSPGYGGKIHRRKSQMNRTNYFPYGQEDQRKDYRYGAEALSSRTQCSMASSCPYTTTRNRSCQLLSPGSGIHDSYICTDPNNLSPQMTYLQYKNPGLSMPPTIQMWLKDQEQLYRSLLPLDRYLRQRMNPSVSRENEAECKSKN